MHAFYPKFPNQPFTGKLPSMIDAGTSDTLYSSGTAPYYEKRWNMAHGRHLAGSDDVVQDEASIPAWASNELDYYAEMDDVQGNGVFDVPGSHPNIYPDAGILASRFDIPGYVAREKMYSPSEVVDATNGNRVIYVNGGAVAMDTPAQVAFMRDRAAMKRPVSPIALAMQTQRMPSKQTWNERQNPLPIGQTTSEPMGLVGMLAASAAIGLAVGAIYAATKKK